MGLANKTAAKPLFKIMSKNVNTMLPSGGTVASML